MQLEEFLHHLHTDPEKITPLGWEIDWEDAPLSYKLYRNLPVIPLSADIPLKLEESEPREPDLERIGHFLWYVYGLAQVSQSVIPTEDGEPEIIQSFRRFPASGGALYPNELYIYLKLADLPSGVYHYDVAHHRLVLLREGNFDDYITRAIGKNCDISSCYGTVFVSTMFWKNFFKYNNFAYRLQGLDAGVLMGQLMEVSKRFGFASGVYFQFLDRAINHLLGIDEKEESVYAVIPLTVEPLNWSFAGRGIEGSISAESLCRELSETQFAHYVRSQRVKEFPKLIELNEASMIEMLPCARKAGTVEQMDSEGADIKLPFVEPLPYDLAEACHQRFSPEMDFRMQTISQEQLAVLLQEASASFLYRNDLDDSDSNGLPRVSIYICLHGVEGIPSGAYRYDGVAHALKLIRPGDHRLQLQYSLSLDNVNMLQVPLCLHVAGAKDSFGSPLGYRGYRIQQMEAGMLVQRVLLAASAIGLQGHPLLGFDVKVCDSIYQMDRQGLTSLIQIPIGTVGQRPWLKGTLHH
ncbi:SagB family peptide dehydrogenase [Bacillus testis]|uniref:SagB family peptide dehydrogenase n=1 Tax=Bacillus testis TaxID=1622072 RepID=UPI00067EB689|nr:SagB family peptide dehydrogenase [Bacillus testis]